MSDDSLQHLNQLFVDYGSAAKPGDSMNRWDFQIKSELAQRLTHLVKDNTDKVNKELETSSSAIRIFCNPILLIFQRLEFIARYFCGEFEIQTKDKKFREVFAGI